MSNYSKTTNFTAKDALPTGNASKVVSGVDFDLEFDNIQTSNNTKVDAVGSGLSIASTTLSFDINSLSSVTPVTGDEIVYEDVSDSNNPKKTTIGTLADTISGLIAGGGIEDNSGALRLNLDSLTNVTPAAGDEFAVSDASDSGLPKAVLFSTLESTLNHDSLAGFVSAEHINHGSVSVTAGNGLTGGGTIAATRTINVVGGTGITANANDIELDISGLTSMTAAPNGVDSFLYNDGGTMKQMTFEQVALPSNNVSTGRNLADSDVGHIVYWTGTSGTLTMVSGVGQDDCWIVLVNSGSGDLTVAGSGVTVNSANSLLTIPSGGMGTLIRESSTVWFLGGNLQ